MSAAGSGCVVSHRRLRLLPVLALVVAGVGAGAVSPAFAQDPDEPRLSLAEPADHVDRLDDAAKVSALRLVVGLTLGSAALAEREDFVARIPAAWNGDLACLRLISPDGLYEGRAQFRVEGIAAPGHQAGLEPIISARNWREIQDRYDGRLMPALTKGACDTDPVDHAVVYARGPGDAAPTIRLAVNAQGAQETFVVVQTDAGMTEVNCVKAGDQGGVGFDHLCDIPFDAINASGVTSLTVNRLTNGEYSPPYAVTLDQVPGP